MREYPTEAIDTRFALLDRYERRCLIHFLRESETDHVSVSEIVKYLHKQDSTGTEDTTTAIRLQHIHLPKLATLEAVEYDSGAETIRYTGDDLIDALVDSTPESYPPDA